MVTSVQDLPTIEYKLFQAVEDLAVRKISSVKLDEELVLVAKKRIQVAINSNSHGPNK